MTVGNLRCVQLSKFKNSMSSVKLTIKTKDTNFPSACNRRITIEADLANKSFKKPRIPVQNPPLSRFDRQKFFCYQSFLNSEHCCLSAIAHL